MEVHAERHQDTVAFASGTILTAENKEWPQRGEAGAVDL